MNSTGLGHGRTMSKSGKLAEFLEVKLPGLAPPNRSHNVVRCSLPLSDGKLRGRRTDATIGHRYDRAISQRPNIICTLNQQRGLSLEPTALFGQVDGIDHRIW